MSELSLEEFIGGALKDVLGALNEFETFSITKNWGATAFPNINQIITDPATGGGAHQLAKTEYLLSTYVDSASGETMEATVINFEFDVAVTAGSEKTKGGKAGIKVLELIEGGANKSITEANNSVSRISFKVPIALNSRVK